MTAQEQFPQRPQVEAFLPWEPESGLWKFSKSFPYQSRFGAGEIQVGTETDFGSIPKWLRGIVDDDDPKALCPYLRHDDRYETQVLPREDADTELHEGMRDCGAGIIKAWLVYRAVRMFGGSHWKTRE